MKYYLFNDVRDDGGELKEFDTLEQAKEHIDGDSEKIIHGDIVWSVNEPVSFPGELKIGKFYRTRKGVKALYVWKEKWPEEPGKICMLCFIEQLNGRIIRTLENGKEVKFEEHEDDIVGEWEGE